MFRWHPLLAQSITEYAAMQAREVLLRLQASVRTLDSHELAAVGVGVALLLFLLLRRGSANLR